MFARLRETVAVLTAKTGEDFTKRPDVIFVEEDQVEPTKIRMGVARAIEALLMTAVFGYTVGLIERALNVHPTVSVSLGKAAAVVALVLCAIGNQQLHNWVLRAWRSLRLAERLAPYFGKGIEETYQILKG